MTGSPEVPDGGRGPDAPRPAVPDPAERPRSGRVAELGLVAAGLGLVVYLLGFVDEASLGVVVGPLLLGGGLLAGSVALPSVNPRLLVPAAVGTVTGALFLLQNIVAGADSAFAIAAFVLALLEAAAATVAALMQTGVVRAPQPKPKPAAAGPYPGGYPQPGQGAFPGQQYPGQPYPGSYPATPYSGIPYVGAPPAAQSPAGPPPAAPAPGDQYAGEQVYGQNARYGAPYGVPGYPPPPPYGTPGYDPAAVSGTGGYGAQRWTDAPEGAGADRAGGPVPTDDPGSAATTVVATGAHRARPASPESPDGREDRTVQVSGAHRARPSWSEPPLESDEGRPGEDAATVVQASGAHRARPAEPSSAGPSSGPSSSPGLPAPGSPMSGSPASGPTPSGPCSSGGEAPAGTGTPPDGADDRTRSIPRVTDDR